MSMPEFPTPNPDMTRDQALNMILSSIALEELALSHIINAEGEKIQYTLANPVNCGCPASTSDILAVNKSVTALLEMVMQNQLLLKNKMEKVLEYMPKSPDPPHPPCRTQPPCPPAPPCPEQAAPVCFRAIPGSYKKCCALLWHEGDCSDHISIRSTGYDKILVPRSGWFSTNVSIEIYSPKAVEGIVSMELNIACSDKKPISKLFYLTVSKCRAVLSGNTTIQLPCSCSPCYASLILHSPECIEIKQGYISFSRA